MVAAALFDPAVPPPGQFAIHSALAGERALFVRRNAHVAKVGTATVEDRLVDEAALDWLGRSMTARVAGGHDRCLSPAK